MDGRLLPTIEQQIPLAVKYETSPLWGPAKGLLGLGRTAAAIGCALCDAYSIGPGFVSYSRSKPYYGLRTNHPLISYDRVMTSVEQLLARDCIEDFRQVPGGRGWQSSMVAKPEFVFLMRGLMGTEKLPLWVPPCPVILRDENGCPVPLSASREISRMVRSVDAINEAVTSVDVRDKSGNRLGAPLVRIFNKNMQRGGRFYGVGGSWQNAPGATRPSITIDGQETVELDFSTLHPSLLYAEAGQAKPADCYDFGQWPRPLAKLALLILVNASSEREARGALARDRKMAENFPYLRGNFTALDKLAGLLMADAKRAHSPIVDFFHSDAGSRLMLRDSRIAAEVMGRMNRKGVVALPVHDSFMVGAKHGDDLREAMTAAAEQEGLKCPRIEEKGKGGKTPTLDHIYHM